MSFSHAFRTAQPFKSALKVGFGDFAYKDIKVRNRPSEISIQKYEAINHEIKSLSSCHNLIVPNPRLKEAAVAVALAIVFVEVS